MNQQKQDDFKLINWWTVGLLILFLWPVGLGLLAYNLYKSHQRKTWEEQKRLQAERLRQEHVRVWGVATPYVQRFVSTYIPGDSRWPPHVSIPTPDIQALVTLLQMEAHVGVDFAQLQQAVATELWRQQVDRFAMSFRQVNPDLPVNPTPEQWARSYVNTFENNTGYTPLLQALMGPNTYAQHAITNEINQRAHMNRVAAVSQAMKSGSMSQRVTVDQVDCMSGLEFEHFLGQLFSALGYSAVVTQASSDQGADLVVTKFGERTVVQAKRYSSSVSNSAVQEVVAAKAFHRCQHAIVVTNNYFTKSAKELAAANSVDLWDRPTLEKLIDSSL